MNSLRKPNAPVDAEARGNQTITSGAESIAGSVAYQGPQKIPVGVRMTMGRLRLMRKYVDQSSLTKRHKTIIKEGLVEYADGSGVWFADQKEWAGNAGCDVKLVIDAVREAKAQGVLKAYSRIYTDTRRVGTSIYCLNSLWSSRPEQVHQEIKRRLESLSIIEADTRNRVTGRHPESGELKGQLLAKASNASTDEVIKSGIDEDVLSGPKPYRESPKSPTPSIGQSMTDFDSSGLDLPDSLRASNEDDELTVAYNGLRTYVSRPASDVDEFVGYLRSLGAVVTETSSWAETLDPDLSDYEMVA